MRRTREQWVALVSTFGKTSQSVDEFCERRGISPTRFRWWRWRLGERPRSTNRSGGVKLLPVDVVDAGPPVAGNLVLTVADVELRFGEGVDVNYIAALVHRLRRP